MAVEGENDAALIRAAQNDSTSFGTLFDRHFGTVYRFCARRVGRDLAEDIAGETFRRAFEARHSYNLRQPNALPWLFRIALNLVATRSVRERPRIAPTPDYEPWHELGRSVMKTKSPRAPRRALSSHGSLAFFSPSLKRTWMPCSSMSGMD